MDWMKLIWEARRRIAPYLQPTPLYSYPLLSDLVGAEIHVKHENHQPTGAFKVRGGINLIGSMPEQEKALGVITASTGNHGQSIAYASRLFGVRSVIGVPENCNPSKLAAMKSWGAEIVIHGSASTARCGAKACSTRPAGVPWNLMNYTRSSLSWSTIRRLAAERGMRYIHPANEPLLIAGVATIALEVLEELPEAEVLICPVGGGSSCAGATLVAQALKPSLHVIGVQAARASSAYESWREKRLVTTGSADTFAEGVQTRVAFEMTQQILWENLKQFVLVEEEEMRQAILQYLEKARVLAEGAGAAPLAAATKCAQEIRGKKVVLYMSGGNVSRDHLVRALTDPHPW